MGRGWGPPYYGDQSSFFMGLNRGKYGISIDLKQPEGIELCLRLARIDGCADRKLPSRHAWSGWGLGYAAVAGPQPAADLLLDLRLRTRRAGPR